VGKVIEYWRECPDILEKNRNTKKFDERERTIFYDTDNILENQRERIRVCRDCSGVLSVDSLTDRGYHIFAVHVPRKACKACQELGREWFETANLRSYDRVFLQDRLEREYLIRKR
jgi:hypothetical protein